MRKSWYTTRFGLCQALKHDFVYEVVSCKKNDCVYLVKLKCAHFLDTISFQVK